LNTAMRAAIEDIFSREYLLSSYPLVSQMDNEYYMPVSAIHELPVIKSLTMDVNLINSILRTSSKVIYNEETQRVKPTTPLVVRNTIILRDIPSETETEEIKALFGNFAKSIVNDS